MSEAHQKAGQSVSIKPRICCRLCLAPENECVSIYKTSAADKQPLSMKINACVQIKVSEKLFFPISKCQKRKKSKSSIIQSFQINLEFEKLSLPWEEKSILSHLVQHYIKKKMRICGKREGDRREKSFISIFWETSALAHVLVSTILDFCDLSSSSFFFFSLETRWVSWWYLKKKYTWKK